MGKLTTHVLDIYHGRPAANMTIVLASVAVEYIKLLTIQTNSDGRCDAPLLEGRNLQQGDEFELLFFVRDYYAQLSPPVESPFLNRVPIRFTVFDETAHYHVPLLVSPWAYSTYRGS